MKKCALVACEEPAVKGDHYCAPCGHWVRVTLADPKYRMQPSGGPPRKERLPGFEAWTGKQVRAEL